jgi:hypothetical protein
MEVKAGLRESEETRVGTRGRRIARRDWERDRQTVEWNKQRIGKWILVVSLIGRARFVALCQLYPLLKLRIEQLRLDGEKM